MKHSKILALGITAALLSACGSKSTVDSNTGSTTANSTTTTTATPTPTPGNVNNLPAAYQTIVNINGGGGTTPTYTINSLTTSRTLKVKVTPVTAPHIAVGGGQWTFPYGCLSVQITVDGSTQQTRPIPVSSAPYGASPQCTGNTYDVLDFSSVTTGDNLGGGRVSVSAHDADYDNCRSYYSPYYYGCYLIALYKDHVASFNLTVQTDGTWMDP